MPAPRGTRRRGSALVAVLATTTLVATMAGTQAVSAATEAETTWGENRVHNGSFEDGAEGSSEAGRALTYTVAVRPASGEPGPEPGPENVPTNGCSYSDRGCRPAARTSVARPGRTTIRPPPTRAGHEPRRPPNVLGARSGRQGRPKYFKVIDAWARKHNTAWVLGETGLSNYSAKIDKTWIRRTYQLMKKYKRCGVLLLQHRAEQQGRLDLGDAEQDD